MCPNIYIHIYIYIYVCIYISDFSETLHVTVLSLDNTEHIQGFSEIPNVWKFHHNHSLSLVFKNGWHSFSDQIQQPFW